MPNIQNLITDNLDIWTGAIKNKKAVGRGSSKKNELIGIKKLRELILELAIRGKLLPQDPRDEPASVLLEKIAIEKELLVKEKKIKKQKPLPEITQDETPFKLPVGWEWTRLQDMINISSGDGLTAKQMNSDGSIPVFGGNGINGYHDVGNVNKPTLVIGRVGFYCGSIHITPENAWITDNAFKTVFSENNIYLHYLSWLLKGTNLKENENATAQPVISGRKVYPIVVGLPPQAEQHHIVKKVDELMALCDQLEEQTEQSITAHQTLVDTLLNAIVNPEQEATAFADSWKLIEQNFELLFTTEQSIDKLKQTILQLAVMGKLVPQDPNDEPASILLEKIAAEKEQLVKEKKIKKQKPLPEISKDEKPFELPKGWEWTYLPNIGELARGKSKHRPRNDPALYSGGTIPLVQTGNVSRSNGSIKSYTALYNEVGLSQSRLWPKGTMCITIAANIADTGILEFEACFPDSVVGFLSYDSKISIKYFDYFIRTAKNNLEKFAPSTAQKNINLEILGNLLVPCPPSAELNHIVKKVDSLMALCDKLKSQLINKKTTQQNLATAFVEKTLENSLQ